MAKILICDDQEVVREGLAHIIGTDPELEVCGLARDGQEALELVASAEPDLVLMDLKMPVMNGIQAIRRLRVSHPKLPILVLTTYADDNWLLDALHSGASGYLLKDRPRGELLDAIKGTLAGKTYLDPNVAGKVVENLSKSPAVEVLQGFELTPREQDLLELLVIGLSNADIAAQLYLSEGTVRNYLSVLFGKLGVSDRTQAVIVALKNGLVKDR